MTATTTPAVGVGAPADATRTAGAASVAIAALRRTAVVLLTTVVAFVVLMALWILLLRLFDVSPFVGKSPLDVWRYLFADQPARGIRPASMTAEQARAESFGALWTTLGNAAVGFVSGMVVATAIAVAFVLFRPFEFAFMPIAMLLRSVPLVAMAPVLLLAVGQGELGIAVIAAVVVLFPALVNIVVGLRSASPQALDLIRVNGGTELLALRKVRLPAALPHLFAAVRISVPGAIVGGMLAEWLVGFEGLGGVLSGYKGAGNYGGVWTVVVLAVMASIVLYGVATVVEAVVLAAWGPEAGRSGR
jgi:ABC-type nitrate/sulfonate/bicarbonate transport system permease component